MLAYMGPDGGRAGGTRQGRGDGSTPRARPKPQKDGPKPQKDGASRTSATARTQRSSGGGASSRAAGRRSPDPSAREDRGSNRRSGQAGDAGFGRSSSGRGRPAPSASNYGRPRSAGTRQDAPADKFRGAGGNAQRSYTGRADPRSDGENRRPRPPAAGRTTERTSFSSRGQRDAFAARSPRPSARGSANRAGAPRRDAPRPNAGSRPSDDRFGPVRDAGPRWGRSRDPLSRGADRSTHFDRDDRSPRVDRYARDDRSARDDRVLRRTDGDRPMSVGPGPIKLGRPGHFRGGMRTAGPARTGAGESRRPQLEVDRDRPGEAAALPPRGGGSAEVPGTTVLLATVASGGPALVITAVKAPKRGVLGLPRLVAAKSCRRAGAALRAMAPAL